VTRTGRVVDPSEGTKEMFTRDRLIGVESGIEPDVARMRPQFASSLQKAVLTSAEVDIRKAALCACLP